MHLVTFRKGSSKPRVGAMVGEAVLDLGALAADLAPNPPNVYLTEFR